jgi:hypothetical protein
MVLFQKPLTTGVHNADGKREVVFTNKDKHFHNANRIMVVLVPSSPKAPIAPEQRILV